MPWPCSFPNSVDFVAAFLAALQLHLIAVPIDRDAPASEVAKILGHFAIRGLVGGSRQDAVGSRQGEIHVGVHVHAPLPAANRLPPTAALIKLTLGSTGAPKGIVTTAANLIADCETICATMGIGPDDLTSARFRSRTPTAFRTSSRRCWCRARPSFSRTTTCRSR